MGLGVKLGTIALAGSAASFANEYSIAFDGTDDFASGSAPYSTFDSQNKISINLWVKRDDVSVNEYAMSQWGNSLDDNFYIYFGGASRIDVALNGSVRTRTTNTMANGTWYNFGFTYDGTVGSGYQRSKFYWNGVEHGSSFNTTFTSLGTYNSPLQFSGRQNSGGTNTDLDFTGNLDEISIWQSALSEADHAAIYNSGTPLDITTLGFSGLTNWWRGGDSNGGTGTVMSDAVGSYNISYFNDNTAFEADVP